MAFIGDGDTARRCFSVDLPIELAIERQILLASETIFRIYFMA